jgi:hypothetical protein
MNISNITVKKNDGTTDIVYTAATGMSGDTPALWYAPALGATAATRPDFRAWSKRVGNSNRSVVKASFAMPYHTVNSTTGVTSVERKLFGKFEMTTDFDCPQTLIDEAVAQFTGLLASTHVRAQVKEGAAAT